MSEDVPTFPAPLRVVVVGGGFGGFFATRELCRLVKPAEARITVVSDTDTMLYQPLLPDVAVGALEPRSVAVPLRTTLPRAPDISSGTEQRLCPRPRSTRCGKRKGQHATSPHESTASRSARTSTTTSGWRRPRRRGRSRQATGHPATRLAGEARGAGLPPVRAAQPPAAPQRAQRLGDSRKAAQRRVVRAAGPPSSPRSPQRTSRAALLATHAEPARANTPACSAGRRKPHPGHG
jgi:hypothetical protein